MPPCGRGRGDLPPDRPGRQSEEALELPLLKSPKLKPKPKVAGITVDTVAMASELETLADKLRATHAEFQRARRVVQASRKGKSRRIKEHRTNITWNLVATSAGDSRSSSG